MDKPIIYSETQETEITRLNYELERISLATGILEQRIRLKQLTEFLTQMDQPTQDQEEPKTKRTKEQY